MLYYGIAVYDTVVRCVTIFRNAILMILLVVCSENYAEENKSLLCGPRQFFNFLGKNSLFNTIWMRFCMFVEQLKRAIIFI